MVKKTIVKRWGGTEQCGGAISRKTQRRRKKAKRCRKEDFDKGRKEVQLDHACTNTTWHVCPLLMT